jgi:replicative DNA helicase
MTGFKDLDQHMEGLKPSNMIVLAARPSRIIGSASKKDDPSDPDANDPNLAIVEIAKNRNGPAMLEVRLLFDQDLTRFRDRAHIGVDAPDGS